MPCSRTPLRRSAPVLLLAASLALAACGSDSKDKTTGSTSASSEAIQNPEIAQVTRRLLGAKSGKSACRRLASSGSLKSGDVKACAEKIQPIVTGRYVKVVATNTSGKTKGQAVVASKGGSSRVAILFVRSNGKWRFNGAR